MPYRTPATPSEPERKDDDAWPSLPHTWGQDLVPPPVSVQLRWTLGIIGAVVTVGIAAWIVATLVVENAWLEAVLMLWLFGVWACGASLLVDACEFLQARQWSASTSWTAGRLLMLATFYVPCVVVGAWPIAAYMAASTILLLVPVLGAAVHEHLTR